jgi:hypothetical protein
MQLAKSRSPKGPSMEYAGNQSLNGGVSHGPPHGPILPTKLMPSSKPSGLRFEAYLPPSLPNTTLAD